MIRKPWFSFLFFAVGVLGLAVGTAIGASMPVGSLLGSKNATLDGQVPLPYTTLLSGDNLQVNNDGLAMVTLDQGNRMFLGHDTEASFLREADAVSVSLTRGSLSLYHPEASQPFRVKVGDVTVAAAKGTKTLGEIAMVDGLLVVTAKDGALQVEKAGTTQEVRKGKTITIAAPAASAPTPYPQSKGHIKHILSISPAALLYLGLGAEAGFVAWAIVDLTSGGGPPASPVMPRP